MTIRNIPDFLKHGDKTLGFPRPTPLRRMRSNMGMGEPDRPVPPFVAKRE